MILHVCSTRIANPPPPTHTHLPSRVRVYAFLTRARVSAANYQFDEVDANHDGAISWDEQWKSVTHGHDFGAEQMEHLGKSERDLFNENDKDGDGSLSLAELNSLLFPDLSKINFHGPQVDHIHGTIDKDGDGHLSLDELKKHGPMVMSALGGMHDEF